MSALDDRGRGSGQPYRVSCPRKPTGLELPSQLSDDVEPSCGSGLHESCGQCCFDRIGRRFFRCRQSQNLEWPGVVLRRANSSIFSTIRDDRSGRSLVFDPPLLHSIRQGDLLFRVARVKACDTRATPRGARSQRPVRPTECERYSVASEAPLKASWLVFAVLS